MELETMGQIQAQKERDMAATEPLPLDAEGAHVAEEKRFAIDNPEYIVQTDPLR